jgi:hypothetical protein
MHGFFEWESDACTLGVNMRFAGKCHMMLGVRGENNMEWGREVRMGAREKVEWETYLEGPPHRS